MKETTEALQARVHAQKNHIPSLYGAVDFSRTPERFTTDPDVTCALPEEFANRYRQQVLNDRDQLERARAYTLLGDNVADAYAALAGQYRIKTLIDWLKQACDQGVENVEDAPAELVAFIRDMERVPEWLDMKRVRKGARISRSYHAFLVPFAIRASFMATFMNKYSGLPMALTGALSGASSVQRINETASFFATATLPGSLDRFGQGFKAAAQVRLMHSLVRFNLLTRSDQWDTSMYGIPIPQVDQMPAGTMPAFLTAFNIVQRGRRDYFTEQEQAVVELCRYQSFLLGLPEDLLPDTPYGIFNTLLVYAATLRHDYDDATLGDLARTTMKAYRPRDHSLKSRVYNEAEKGFSRVFFTRTFLRGKDKSMARKMGVQPGPLDYAFFAASNAFILPRLYGHLAAARIPVVNQLADRRLVHRINDLLEEYGHPEYSTRPDQYNG